MKKINFLLILIILFTLFTFSGCSLNSLTPAKITTDAVVVERVSLSKVAAIEEEAIVRELTSLYNSLKLKKINKNIDVSSVINVVFYEDKKEKSVLSVDKNGLLYLYRDEENIFKILNKDFNYSRVEQIYEEYKSDKE